MPHELRRSDFLNLAISSAEKLEIDLHSAKEKKLLNSLSFEHFAQEIDEIKKVLSTFSHNRALPLQFEHN